ncbi:MAG TPA: serine/threonine-protein kinase [Solirubrobacteraceae bacterium]|nr:serine/threonine-protein kinase [Solirubrobacteraceae bacterium]
MDRVLSAYQVEQLIGRGGMGEVYLARDPRLDRPVALKVLGADLAGDERFRERLLRESRLAAALDHPNVVPIYEAGEAEGRLFIAMRYVDGTDLRALLRRHGALEPERALGLGGQVAEALDAAHERGLVHRDVKPSNVLVDDPGGRDHCYLADFGLTQSASDRGPADGSLMGTLDYVAPEQIRGDPIDGRADQYGLACLLFECLTGTLPFRRDSDMATIFAHLEEQPPAASDHRQGLPPELDAVLERGMDKDPAERYESCAALVADARAALGVDAEPARRTRLVLLVAALAALLAGALAVVLVTGGEDRAAARAPGALVRIDPETAKVSARHEIGGRPSALAAGAGTVWVGSHVNERLWRFDPRSGGATRIPTTGSPWDLAYHHGRIYVAADGPGQFEGIVVAYDAASGTRQDGVELVTCSITAGFREGVWASGCADNVEQLVGDPRELRIVHSLTLPFREPVTSGSLRRCQCDMASGDGSIWVAGDAADSRVWRIDSKRGRVLDTIELPFPIGRGIAAGDGALWVAGALDDLVARVDARTGRVTDRIEVGRAPTALALSDGRLWVANQLDRTVSLVDVRRRRVVRTIDVGGAPVGLAAGAGGVWAAIDG